MEGKSFLFDDQKIWKGYPSIFMIKNLEGKSFQKIKYILEGKSFYILKKLLKGNEVESYSCLDTELIPKNIKG